MRASITALFRATAPIFVVGALSGCAGLPPEGVATDAGGDAGDAINCGAEPTAAGCPCNTEGTTTPCYPTWGVVQDDRLLCDIGTQACRGGHWSACENIEHISYDSSTAIINPLTECNPCSPACTRATDTPVCTPAFCDLCTPERRAALIGMGMAPCVLNSSTTSYESRGVTPAVAPPVVPTLTDTDMDGIPDVADMCPGPGAFLAADGSCYGDLFFYHQLPFGGPAAIDPAPISLQIRTADVYVLMDTTGSMGGELARLRTDLTTGSFLPSVPSCGNGILGAIRCTIPDAWFGVANFDDVPYYTYGTPGYDYILQHRTDITPTLASAQAGVNALGLHGGYDGPEGNLLAMWAGASGNGVSGYLAARTGCPAGRWGYPCFRPGTIPIMIQITDAPFHNGPPDPDGSYNYGAPIAALVPTWSQVVSTLNARDIRVMTVQSCGSWGSSYCLQGERVARALGNATGSLGSAGTPYVFRINADGTGMSATIVNAVRDLANYSRMDVSARASGDTMNFTQSITAVSWGVGSCTGISGGTVFTQCLPGTAVNFNVQFRNTSVMPTMTPQVFSFFIEIVGDGTVVLARIPVRIVVPPVVPAYQPEGRYYREYDSTMRCDPTIECVDWNVYHFAGSVPPNTRMRFEFRTANSAGGVSTATPIATYEVTNAAAGPGPAYSVSGDIDVGALLEPMAGALPGNFHPYLRAEVVLISSPDRTTAPALSSMELRFDCVPCG